MRAEAIFAALQEADIGAYAVTPDQKIVFWNRGAEQILGYTRNEVLGRRCYEVLAGTQGDSLIPSCVNGCPSMHAVRARQIPETLETNLLQASGERTAASLTPMIVAGDGDDGPILIHLFERTAQAEAAGQAESDRSAAPRRSAGRGRLAPREMEVLRLVARGRSTQQIADELEISPHTVRNHVRHFRRKLEARTKLDAVMTAIRLGILEPM